MRHQDMKPGDAETFNKAAARAVNKVRPIKKGTKRYEALLEEILHLRNGASALKKAGIITDAQHSAAYTKANELIDLLPREKP
jgi:hypothetical protein